MPGCVSCCPLTVHVDAYEQDTRMNLFNFGEYITLLLVPSSIRSTTTAMGFAVDRNVEHQLISQSGLSQVMAVLVTECTVSTLLANQYQLAGTIHVRLHTTGKDYENVARGGRRVHHIRHEPRPAHV